VKTYRLAVCKGPNCREGGADQIFSACREVVSNSGMSARCEVYRAGCYGLCHLGPNVVLRENPRPRDPLAREDFQLMGWDGEFHYPAMTVQKIARVIAEHVAKGRALEELLGASDDASPSPSE
jgi:(2Fe-2S) ferredoxin